MKLIYSLIALITFSTIVPLQASHLMGGELTARHIGGFDFEVKLTVYRDTLGIEIYNNATLKMYDTAGVFLATQTISLDGSSGALLPLFPYGVEEYFYIDTLTFPGPGKFTISWAECCRNGAIINADAPDSYQMQLICDVTVYDPTVAVNSTPVFLNKPVTFMPISVPWTYNPLPFDPDGDSLVWSITDPLRYIGLPLPGYYDPPGDPLNPFSIDPFTGTITWTPNMLGNFVASIAVDEYRGGVHIGRIIRDMQLIVVPIIGAVANFDNLSSIPTNDEGYYFETLYAGYPYSLSLLASDPDLSDQLRMEATGEPFLLSTSPASFSFALTGVDNNIEGIFNWTPDDSAIRDDNYLVVFRLDDQTFATDLTIVYEVIEGTPPSSTGIENFAQTLRASLSPNPTNGPVMLNLELQSGGETRIFLYSTEGRRLLNWSLNLPSGISRLLLNEHLSKGQYYVVVENENHRQTMPLVITE